MSAAKGWEGELVVQHLSAQIIKERMMDGDGNDATGDGSETTFYSRSFPITDSSGTVTDDETDVTVYLDDTEQLSTAFTLTGDEGKIVFNTAPAADKKVYISYYYKKSLADLSDAGIDHDGHLEERYVWGSRLPKEVKEGNIEIGLTIGHFFVHRDLANKALSLLKGGGQEDFDVIIYPAGNSGGKPKITLGGVKFGPWSLSESQDGFAIENLTGKATSIAFGTVP